ncbi:MAG: hypothetical protein U0414_30145 [Polyangiaceae bacterium]
MSTTNKSLSTTVRVGGDSNHTQPQLAPKVTKNGKRRVTFATTVAEVGNNNHNVALLG